MRNIPLKSIALVLLLTAAARAATNIIDFNTDPKLTGLYSVHGNVLDVNGLDGTWRPSGGASGGANDGYLGVTDASTGSHSVLVFKDLEAGLVVKAFTFECDVRIGGGTGNGTSPADGFSISYASADDPIVVASDADTDPAGLFAGTVGEPAPSGLAEEGATTGLSIGFDSWSSGQLIASPSVWDVVGLSIRVDGQIIAQLPTPLKPGNVYYPTMPLPGSQGTNYEYDVPGSPPGNGATAPSQNVSTNDPLYLNSLQTGARNTTDDLNADGVVDATDDPNTSQQPPFGTTVPDYNLWMKNLKWEHFKAELTEDGHVKITYKGVEITPPGGIASTFNPRPGRIIFAGRTGGAWQDEQVDNIKLVTVPADTLVIGNATGNALGFKVIVIDSGPAVSDTNTLVLKFNDVTVTPSSVTKTNGQTIILYQQSVSSPLAAGSTNKVSVSIKDTRAILASADRFFVVGPYSTIPTAYAVTGVDTTKSGFWMRPYQTAAGNPNTLIWTEEQLAGLHGPNIADLTGATFGVPGIATTGFYERDTVINFTIDGNADGTPDPAGNFQDPTFPDELLPGILETSDPAIDLSANSTEEVYTWLNFPTAGYYTMGVNSDDGFKVTTGKSPGDQFSSLNLGQFNGGRGASDTTFSFIVNQAGFYPFRLLWQNGGGGANCEWFTVNPDGTKALVNDTTNPNAVRAYRGGPALPAYVSVVSPGQGAAGVFPNIPSVLAKLVDGGTQVSSSTLSLNGGAPVAGTKSGGITTTAVPLSSLLLAGSTNNATLVWTDSVSGTTTDSWTFVVATYVNLPTDLVSPLGSGDNTKLGFTVSAYQVDNTNGDTENNNVASESELAGLYGLNIATLSTTGGAGYLSNNVFAVTTWINWDRGANDGTGGEDGNFRAAGGYPEDPVPGITGGGGGATFEAVAEGVQTYVEFPTAGFYQMGVNSDDNFSITLAEGPPAPAISISGPTNKSLAGVSLYLLPGVDGGGRVNFGVQAASPITAPIIYMTPGGIDDPGPYPNVTGKIALLDRSGSNLGSTGTGGKVKAAQDAGAVAILVTTPTDTGYSGYAGATRTDINVPVFIIPHPTAASLLKSYLTNSVAVTGTVRGNPSFSLGGFDNGRGATDTIMNFGVSQAGLYPMRLLFHQGGGGMNCEWFSLKPDGTRVLVGDTAKGGLKAYRVRTAATQLKFNAPVFSSGNVTLTWTGTGTLQQASSLTGSPADWSDVSPQPSGNTYTVSVGVSGNKFYRLKQ